MCPRGVNSFDYAKLDIFLYPYHIITNSSISVLSIFIHNIHYTAFMAQCQEICLYISAQTLKITCFLFFQD